VGFFDQYSALRRSVALLLVVTFSAGCVSWQRALGRESYLTTQRPNHVQVVFADGRREDLYTPAVAGNQLVGYRQSAGRSFTSIPIRDVRSIEVLRVDGQRTALLVGTVGVLAVLTAIAVADFQSWKCGCFSLR
jgi:hypothetical protein